MAKLRATTKAKPPLTPRKAWHAAELDASRRIDHARKRARFSVAFPGAKPIGITFASDQHIAPGTPVDFRRMREDAQLVAKTPGLYALLGGDGVDNHIKHRAAVLAARSQPGDQYQLYEHYLGWFGDSLLGLISGNHDAWTDQVAGVDMVAQIAQRNGLCYCPAEAYFTLRVGQQRYKIAFRHQYRLKSALNPCHAVKQWYRLGEETFDIGCICHEHEPSIEAFEAHGVTRWACRPGSYQITSGYSRQFGWNATGPTCPTFVLYPKRREIIGFHDVRHAARFLKHERGGK